MRAVVQRVISASVEAGGSTVAETGKGILVLFGVHKGDVEDKARFLASKIANMRIFEDDQGKMNLSVIDVGGEVLAVPQFTLAADTRKGRRPSFDTAEDPDKAQALFELFCDTLAAEGVKTARGAFQEHLHVSLTNDGPVTFVLEK